VEQRPHVVHWRSPKSTILIPPWLVIEPLAAGWPAWAATRWYTTALCPALSSRQMPQLPSSEDFVVIREEGHDPLALCWTRNSTLNTANAALSIEPVERFL